MYRRERDREATLRKWRRFVKIRTDGSWPFTFGAGPWANQEGRFRKGSGLGCPNGRSKCGICTGWVKEPTRQELRSDINFEEYREEVT